MEFEQSSLYLEVKNIINEGVKPVHFRWKATIHTKTENIDVIKVVSIDTLQDFELSFNDEISLSFMLPLGTYIKRVFPYRNDLEITLTKIPVSELGSETDQERGPSAERFVAVLMDQGNPVVESDGQNLPSEESLNLTSLSMITVQLIDKAVDQIRMRSFGGIYRNVLVGDMLKSVLTKESQMLELDKEYIPLGVNMIPPDNKVKRNHILVPQGTKLTYLAQYIQDHCGGIYSTGIGFYYWKRFWYVFPLYNTERVGTIQNGLTIINIPNKKLKGIERTYRKNGSNLVIAATGHVSFSDESDKKQLVHGNGARFADANKFMNGFSTAKGNKVTASRSKTVNEVKTTSRPSGNNNVHLSPRAINANVYREYSELAPRDGSVINLSWENSDESLIFPGMPVKILYLDGENIAELSGTLIKAQSYTHTSEQVMYANKLITNTALSVFVNRKKILN